MQMANKVGIRSGRLMQTLIRHGGLGRLQCRVESTLMSSGAAQEAVNAVMTRCAPLHHAASHPCSSVHASQCSRNQTYETRTAQAFMSTNSRVNPPTVSTRERAPERRDSGNQSSSASSPDSDTMPTRNTSRDRQTLAELEKKFEPFEPKVKAQPSTSAKDDEEIP